MVKKNWIVDWIGYWLVKALARLLTALPVEAALHIGRVAGRAVGFFHSRRRVAYVNLKAAFGVHLSARERRDIIQRMYEHGGMSLVELFFFPKINAAYFDTYVEENGTRQVAKLQAQGAPVMCITAHVGNWEFAQIAHGIGGVPLMFMAQEQKLKRLDELLNTYRLTHGARLARKGAGVRAFLRELASGGVVGLLGDQSGGRDSVRISFFGRETTAARGPIAIAKRTGARVLLWLGRRVRGPYHRFGVQELQIPETGDFERDVQAGTQAYFDRLEAHIRECPEQWLWAHKRWKHCWTKRLALLTDGKSGHEAQTKALLAAFEEVNAREREPVKLETVWIPVRYKSRFHRALLYLFAPLLYPWAQGRLALLRAFLSRDSAHQVACTYADILISTGSGLLPILHLMARENGAKRLVALKAPFPYSLFQYDLAVLPEHDRPAAIRNAFFATLAPTAVNPERAREAGEDLRRARALGEGPFLGVLIGGTTGTYRFDAGRVREMLSSLLTAAGARGAQLLVTTSRRTERDVEAVIRDVCQGRPGVPQLIIAREDPVAGALLGILGLSQVVCVTADSIAMVSEALSAEKPVLVFDPSLTRLPSKHVSFLKGLEERGLLKRTSPERALADLEEAMRGGGHQGFRESEHDRLLLELREVIE